jgi:plasmid maintenance system antidote protein VapI
METQQQQQPYLLGEYIRRVVEEKRLPIADFAQQLCMHRTAVYKRIFAARSLSIDLIFLISKILDHDILRHYYGYTKIPR